MCKFTIIYPFYDYYYSTLIYHLYHDYHLFKYWSMESGTSDVVEFDLETLEPLANTGDVQMTDIVNEICYPILPVQVMMSIREMHLILIFLKITITTKCPQTVKTMICLHILSTI